MYDAMETGCWVAGCLYLHLCPCAKDAPADDFPSRPASVASDDGDVSLLADLTGAAEHNEGSATDLAPLSEVSALTISEQT
jgi:hypothetical protein